MSESSPGSFAHQMRVRYSECDQLGIVFNANYLTYADVALGEFWREHFGGYSTLNEIGLDLVVAESRISFRRPLRFDQEFRVLVSVATLTLRSLRMEFAFWRDRELASRVSNSYVCFGVDGTGAKPIPAKFRETLQGLASTEQSSAAAPE